MSMLQRLLSNPTDKTKKEEREEREKKKEEENERCEEVEEGQPHNPYTEVLILQYHSDIVRLLMRLNDRRFVSAGDDSKAVIWEVQYGRRIAVLEGHSHPITSLLLLPPVEENDDTVIISGSSDKQIRIWDAETGKCLHVLTKHGGSVRCLLLLNQGLFCAGGENLSLWNRHGQLLHLVPNRAIEDILLMISIKSDGIVTAADKELVVYKLKSEVDGGAAELVVIKHNTSHREAIHSLVPVSTSCFASGSVDGMIIIWSSSTLEPAKKLNDVSEYEGKGKRFPYSVQALMSIQERYLFAAIGCGFYAYDVIAEKKLLVVQKKSAHLSKITTFGFACEGEFLATCSEDGCLRLWGRKSSGPQRDDMAVTTMERFRGIQYQELSYTFSNSPWEPALLGECCAHGGSVQGFLDFDHEGIVTCGADGLVIIWKNTETQKVRRNQLLMKLLTNCDGII